MAAPIYTVLGATGQTGGATARTLLKDGQRVRVVVRDKEKFSGASKDWSNVHLLEVVEGSLEDVNSLTKAFSGAAGAFIMTPPLATSSNQRADHKLLIEALEKAVQASHIPKVVILSSIGAHKSSGTGAILKLYDLEQSFFKLGIPVASLRAAWFFENFRGGLGKDSSSFPCFINPTTLEIPMIATQDVGEAAAFTLKQTWVGNKIIDVLHGPKTGYSADDIAKDYTSFYGRPIVAEPVPSANYVEAYKSFGFHQGAAESMAEMNNGFNSKWIVYEGETEKYFGKLSFLDVLKHL